MIAIVDYGMGNLGSVAKAFAFLGAGARITSSPEQMARAKAVVFPGVGAFGEAMRELKKRRLIDPIVDAIGEGKPFLGLCLGLQLLFERSEEAPGVRGLGVLPGLVRRLPRAKGLKVPHMGWNQIEMVHSSWRMVHGKRPRLTTNHEPRTTNEGGGLLDGIPNGAFMYFVHSYVADPSREDLAAAMTEYGCRFPSVIWNGECLWATQFHPEKSQRWGLKILRNFLERVISC